jgi:hypothetical protein
VGDTGFAHQLVGRLGLASAEGPCVVREVSGGGGGDDDFGGRIRGGTLADSRVGSVKSYASAMDVPPEPMVCCCRSPEY